MAYIKYCAMMFLIVGNLHSGGRGLWGIVTAINWRRAQKAALCNQAEALIKEIQPEIPGWRSSALSALNEPLSWASCLEAIKANKEQLVKMEDLLMVRRNLLLHWINHCPLDQSLSSLNSVKEEVNLIYWNGKKLSQYLNIFQFYLSLPDKSSNFLQGQNLQLIAYEYMAGSTPWPMVSFWNKLREQQHFVDENPEINRGLQKDFFQWLMQCIKALEKSPELIKELRLKKLADALDEQKEAVKSLTRSIEYGYRWW